LRDDQIPAQCGLVFLGKVKDLRGCRRHRLFWVSNASLWGQRQPPEVLRWTCVLEGKKKLAQ